MKKISTANDTIIHFKLTSTKEWEFSTEPVVVSDADAVEIYARLSDNIKVEEAGDDEVATAPIAEVVVDGETIVVPEVAPIVEAPVKDGEITN